MSVGEAQDRRGRRVRGRAGLLEREQILAAIEDTLDAALAGNGQALLIVGHPGMGKTRLYEAALDEGRGRGMRVLRAAGAELEQNLAFGLAAQIARASVTGLAEEQRDALVRGAPPLAQALLGGGLPAADAETRQDLAVAHALFTLLAESLEMESGLLAIDDVHWSDPASVESLLYLLQRLDELSLSMILTSRPGVRGEAAEVLELLAAHNRVEIETLTPLGASAIARLVEETMGDRADEELLRVSEEATAGNPFYLHELLIALKEETGLDSAQLTARARSLAPDAVTRSVRVRVGRLGSDAAALARAVAVFGDDVPMRHAAALAGLDIRQASEAADALASVEVLLAREPLRFVHPLVRHSIERDIPASELATRHLDAARLLDQEQADPERIAAHLLVGRAQGDAWAVERLCAAAREARTRLAPQSAVRYLERALAEPPPPELRGDVLAELGSAEASIGLPAAAEHLAAAARATTDPRRRAELARRRGQALHAQGRHQAAAAAYEEGLAQLPKKPQDPEEHELHDALQTGFVATASLVPSLQEKSVERSSRLLAGALKGPQTRGQRQLLAQAALHASFAGLGSGEVIRLAERAWDGGRLLEQEGVNGVGWSLLASALCLAGDLERAIEISDAALEEARRVSSPQAFATASYMRGLPKLWQGQVSQALSDLESALDARRFGWRQFARAAAGHYAMCLLETGDLDRADEVLSEEAPAKPTGDVEDAARLYALAELRRAQGRAAEALEVALAAGRLVERNVPFLGYCPWRGSAAQAALALGDHQRARILAREVCERTEQTEVRHQRIRAFRIMGMCLGGEEGIALLRQAVELALASPPRLETIRALVELGSALRRSNERAAARDPLQQAADLARQGGAVALYERARVELSASGARPRRGALLSGPGSLTPSERRIAQLACNGHSNREIAQTLFVTPKTVEYHLRNTYRKLGIQTRRELSEALRG
jgi:DNA-binding CsgD family transcriptional regulator